MIVNAQVYVGNMSAAKVQALMGLTVPELASLTGFHIVKSLDAATGVQAEQACSRDDCLVTWAIDVDPSSPGYAGESLVREDFIAAILDIVEDVK